ncbi:MAG TPA: energy transducer TonB [Longimicrobium sp.]|nr:energy transducer TonB [Longimicrobium sp.]
MAHAAAIGAIAVYADDAEAKPMVEEVIAEWKIEDDKPVPKPPPPPPPEPEPPAPKEPPKVELAPEPEPEPVKLRAPRPPAPVKGDFVTPRPPQNPPVGIPAPDLNAQPITQVDVSGIGKEGDVVGTVDPGDQRAPTGNTQPSEAKEAPPAPPAPPAAEPAEEAYDGEPMEESEVDVRPSLRNGDAVQSALQRAYPSMLRDAGVTGETVLQFVIDENGRVEPGSVEIVSSSDEAFAAAARRVVSSMRFSPAKSRGRTVRVTTTLPVRWTIQ